jgi:hypothetical protein
VTDDLFWTEQKRHLIKQALGAAFVQMFFARAIADDVPLPKAEDLRLAIIAAMETTIIMGPQAPRQDALHAAARAIAHRGQTDTQTNEILNYIRAALP